MYEHVGICTQSDQDTHAWHKKHISYIAPRVILIPSGKVVYQKQARPA